MAGATMLSTFFRCVEKPVYPMAATIASALLNTVLNYILIFGAFGLPAMGANGAAIATTVSQFFNFFLILLMSFRQRNLLGKGLSDRRRIPFDWAQYTAMLLPILICEAAWSLGENVYAAIYGHMSTEESAAMNR